MQDKAAGDGMRWILTYIVCLLPFFGTGDVLQWQITGNETVDGNSSIYTYIGTTYGTDMEMGMRIAAYDSQGNFVSYLNPIYGNPDDPQGSPYIDYEFNDQWIGTRENFWMTRASQALCTSELAIELRFQMQLGLYDNNDDFSSILYTDAVLVDGKYRYVPGTLDPPSMDWQMQDFYTINPVIPITPAPEPSITLLFLVGAAVLLLKRKTA